MSKVIAIIGTLDTKGDQIQYLKKLIEAIGHQVCVIDVGILGDVPIEPAISRHQVAEAAGTSIQELIDLRHEWMSMERMTEGASKIVKELHSKNRLDGALAVGGSIGTALALSVMKALPIGVPKLIVSTVAYSPGITPDMVSGDLMMLPWVAGLWGFNKMSKRVLETAAGAISGAVELYDKEKVNTKKVVAVSSLGGTVCQYMNQLKPALEERGYEVAVFHVTGMSGRLLEQAITEGSISAVLDLSVGVEILNEVCNGVASAGEHRLEAAAKCGVPQIVSPGAIEAFHWGEDKPFPAKYKERPQHRHNPILNVILSSKRERAAVGRFMAEKLNMAAGPTIVVIPMRGFEPPMRPASLDAFWQGILTPHEGLKAFRRAFMRNLKNPKVKVVTLDGGFNDPPYVTTILSLFDEMMSV